MKRRDSWTIVLAGGPLSGPEGHVELEVELEDLPAQLPLLPGGQYVRSASHGLRYEWVPAPARVLTDERLRELAAGTGFSVDALIEQIRKSRLEPPGIAPEQRLRWVTARATAEVLEALDADDRLLPHDRELISSFCHSLMQIVQIIHDGREAERAPTP